MRTPTKAELEQQLQDEKAFHQNTRDRLELRLKEKELAHQSTQSDLAHARLIVALNDSTIAISQVALETLRDQLADQRKVIETLQGIIAKVPTGQTINIETAGGVTISNSGKISADDMDESAELFE